MPTSLTLSNGSLELAIDRPGAAGTYCGTRFSWAGVLSQARCQGHVIFGPWRPGCAPLDEHDSVSGTAGEFGMGIAGMPVPLGFAEAAPGGHFVKIGVGVLCRPDTAPYSFARRYEIVEAPAWQVEQAGTWVEMRQTLAHGVYDYEYSHRIELVEGEAAFITRHTLLNAGGAAIHQAHYSHNFLMVDQQPIGPAYEVTFPFAPVSSLASDSVARFNGSLLTFREPIPADQAVFTPLSGFGNTVLDNGVMVRHRDAGVEVRIRGDKPVMRYHLFAVAGAVCPEPFVELHVAPGETITWQSRYDVGCTASVGIKEMLDAKR